MKGYPAQLKTLRINLTMNPYPTISEAVTHRPPKKVLGLLENFGPMTGELATTLFLGDLSVTCDEVKLFELFRPYGVIESIQLKKSDRDPQRAHLGFGFIRFANRDCAERALQEINGCFFLGRVMRVGWAVDYGKKTSQALVGNNTDPKKSQTAQIHVMFVTRELTRRVSELDLGGVFGRYGNLVDIAIKKNAVGSGVQSGYAFLHYALTREGLSSAVTAVKEVNHLTVDNITYRCKVTHSLQTQLMYMKQREERELGKRELPPSISHFFPISFDDSTFKSYDAPSHDAHTADLNFTSFETASTKNSSLREYHENDFYSFGMKTRPSDQTYETLPPHPPRRHTVPPSFYDLKSVEMNKPRTSTFSLHNFSNDRINTNTTDIISSSFTTDDSTTTTYNTLSNHHFNDRHSFSTRPLSLSLSSLSSSSFLHSASNDALGRRRSDDSNNHDFHDMTRF